MTRSTDPRAPLPGRPSQGNPAAEAADPYRKSLDEGADAGPAGSDSRAREQEQAALDNVREKYDLPIGSKPRAEQPATPLPEGPNDLGRKNSTPP